MRYRFYLVFVASILFWLPNAAFCQEPVRVIVLPFDIHAREEMSYLKLEIPKLIERELGGEGAVVLDPPIASDPNWREQMPVPAGLRDLGIQTGADSIIWGSLTRIGNKYSLDARMLTPFEEETESFFLQGEGIENLIGSVRELARNLSLKLFKQAMVARIVIEGNRRIESDAIERVIKTKPGDMFLPKNLSADLKSVFAMGYFEDIRVEAEDSPEGKIVIFHVQEKPTIRNISFSGNKLFKDEEIRENMTLKAGSILNIFQIQNNIRRIEEMYKGKNFHNVVVSYKALERENNVADLQFSIEEGQKVMIREIDIVGNDAFSDKDLKKIMKTSEKGFFSFITSSGELDKEELTQDVNRLTAFYQNKGYVQAKIGDPQLEYRDNWIHVTFRVEEGPRYKVDKVDIAGDLVKSKEELLSNVKITKEQYYNREILRSDVLALTDVYSDEGYAYANISPRIDRDPEKHTVNIAFEVEKGKQAYFERIDISGNTKTRDKVIRRELDVHEQELFSGRRLKRGVRNLHRLDFFEDIKVNTLRGSAEDQMILDIEVKEKPTGAFSFGGGYSSIDRMFLVANISQRNLFGKSQRLNLGAHLGGRTTQYTLSFTEPWLFDIPLSAGFDLYDLTRDYDTYDKDAQGGALRFGYPIYDFTHAYLSYRFERADIRNVTSNAARSIKELEGFNVQSSVTTSVQYDSRDRVFNPTQGSDHSLTLEYAGLGGDIGFVKLVADTGWYIPLFWETVGFVHGRAGVVRESADKILPDYEKFYLGGLRSLRGYNFQDVSLRDEEGAKIGGEKFVQFNLEYIFPLVKKAGLSGVAFFDTGNVFASDEEMSLGGLFMSAGGGVRWYSPIGPIRLEWGYPLNPDEVMRDTGRWEFSMGGSFW